MSRKYSSMDSTLKELNNLVKPYKDIYKGVEKLAKKKDKKDRYNKLLRERKRIEKERELVLINKSLDELAYKERIYNKNKNNIIKYCPSCGSSINNNYNYCFNCGYKLYKSNNKYDDIKSSERKELCDKFINKDRLDISSNISIDELHIMINDLISYMNNTNKCINNYINNNTKYFSIFDLYDYVEKTDDYVKRVNSIRDKAIDCDNSNLLIDYYNRIIVLYNMFLQQYKFILNKEKGNVLIKDEVAGNDMSNYLDNINYSKLNNDIDDNDYKDYKDDIVYRELEDWQKKEVDEGRYDSYNFEEEELEEDDYYSEDDK